MTITLCMETTGPHCSLALAVGEQIYVESRILQRTHNEHLLPMLDDLFASAGIKPTDVELVAFACGPGSFTGVRIAAAATQAVAFAAHAAVLPVPSSLLLACSAQQALPTKVSWITCLPSRGQAYYVAAYAADDPGSTPTPIHTDQLVEAPPAWFAHYLSEPPKNVGEFALVGSAPDWLPAEMQGHVAAHVQPAAAHIVDLARRGHAEGESLSAEYALPTYVTGDSPWKKAQRNIA